MPIVVFDKLDTVFTEADHSPFVTTWYGHVKTTGDLKQGVVTYEEPDGFVEAWYIDPTNSADEIDGVAAP